MTQFQSVKNIGDKLLLASLEDNIKSFLDWGFLNIGGFINVNIPTSGINNGGFHILKPKNNDPNYSINTVWESPRKDWIAETGILYSGASPISINGIYINNNLIPAPTGNNTYTYRINYPLGQIIFNQPIPANTSVTANYSYRYVQVYKSSEAIWWKELQELSYNPNIANNNKESITANHRIQMPAIIVENIARTIQIPYELGNVKNIIGQDVLLHVFSENPVQRNSIIDILMLQKDKQTFLYDINRVISHNINLLDYLGQKNPNGLNYGQIVSSDNYRSNIFYIHDASITEFNTISSSLYNGIVRWSLRIFP